MMWKNFKIWLRLTASSFQQTLSNRLLVLIFLIGKILRLLLFIVFLTFLFRGTRGIGDYSREQIIFFYLSFNLIDTLAQLLFREVYRFRDLVVSGNLDFILLKPSSPLVRVLMGGGDVLDLMMLVLIVISTVWFGLEFISTNPWQWALYILLLINGLLIAAAFHIAVLGVGIVTTSIDHLIMVYRDFSSMLRIPVDLYTQPIRSLLTFVIPIGVMITFPPKALMGLLSPSFILMSFIFSLVFFSLAVLFWRHTLKYYSSASS